MSEEVEPHIANRYQLLKKLGKGAYGIVWKAKDRLTDTTVALKKVYDAFQNATDAQRTYREVMYLQHLNGHANIVRLLSIHRAHNNKDLYLVFDAMDTDLHMVIRAGVLKSIHKTFVAYQLFKALKYLHSAGLVHRDLKPSNLLINSECEVKLADFGLARSVKEAEGESPIVSDYIATRWYRAPEIVLGSKKYDETVDMWSAGCILAELMIGNVLFAGKSSLNQIELIVKLLGRPTAEDIKTMKIGNGDLLVECEAKKSKSITSLFKGCSSDAIDLIRKLLVYNPEKRINVEEALKHPFFAKFHCEEEEIECKKIIVIPIDDNEKLSLKAYRDAIYRNISNHIKKHNPLLQLQGVTTKSRNPKEFLQAKTINKQKKKSPSNIKKIGKATIKKTSKSLGSKNNENVLSNHNRTKKPSQFSFKKKNKSEDIKGKGHKKKYFSQTTKFNKQMEISKSNIYAEKAKLKKAFGGAHIDKEKGFFRVKRDRSSKKILSKNKKKGDNFDYQTHVRKLSGLGHCPKLIKRV